MSSPALYLVATGHGFGHAVRLATVAQIIHSLRPQYRLILVTPAPRWLLESYITGEFIHRPRALDVGVIQSDSLTMDKRATLAKMQHIYRRRAEIIQGEVNFILNNRVDLVLGDIPALAPLIAQKAGIPCWMMGNFGWDFIYRGWGTEFAKMAAWISESYHQCDRLFRLPLSEPMSAFRNITEAGLTGGKPRYSIKQLRRNFAINVPVEKTVLLTFGGLGLQAIPYHHLARFPDWQFITFEQQAPDLPNLRKITDLTYRPVDLMPICGRVISKPGFSTFAEALRLDKAVVSLTRDDFPEADLLLNGIKNHACHQIITPEAFFQENWDFLNQPPEMPLTPYHLPKDGSETIAQAIIDYFG